MTNNSTQDQPLVTFALFAYKQESYIREAVESALCQTYEPLEIILSDDCSPDDTFKIMEQVVADYKGPHIIRLRRNEVNLGLAKHFSQVMIEAHGDYIVLAAGDDISYAGRTTACMDIFLAQTGVSSVLLSADIIDSSSKITGSKIISKSKNKEQSQTLKDLLARRHVTFGASRAIRKDVFTRFGSLNNACPTEDTPLLLRSLICGTNVLSPQKGVAYRRHATNLSGTSSMAVMNNDAIYDQYEADIAKAREFGGIQEAEVKKLRFWASLDKSYRSIRQAVSSGQKLHAPDLFFVIRHPMFGLKVIIKSFLSKRAQ